MMFCSIVTVPSKTDIVDDAVATAETAPTPMANTNDDKGFPF